MEALQITSFEQVPHGLTVLLQRVSELIELQRTPTPTVPSDTEGVLLTRKQVAKKLMVSLPTLNELTKNGKLTGYRIGNRLRYKSNEIEGALTRIKTKSTA